MQEEKLSVEEKIGVGIVALSVLVILFDWFDGVDIVIKLMTR